MGDAVQVVEPQVLYCINHPTRETLLRCSKCDRPICVRCGIRTPVGIRCRDCAQMRRPPPYMLASWHYLLAAVVALPASFLAGLLMQQVGIFFAFWLGAPVGGAIAEIVYRATGGKRGRNLILLISACILVGAVASAIGPRVVLEGVPLAALLDARALLALFVQVNVIYVVLAIGAVFARLS